MSYIISKLVYGRFEYWGNVIVDEETGSWCVIWEGLLENAMKWENKSEAEGWLNEIYLMKVCNEKSTLEIIEV